MRVWPRSRTTAGERRGRLGLLAMTLGLAILAPSVFGAASTNSIRIAAGTPKTDFVIGDRIEYAVTVDWKRPVRFLRIEPSEDLGGFEIPWSPQAKEKKRFWSPWRQHTERYLLTTLQPGTATLPTFHVVYRDGAGQERRLATPPVRVNVRSVLAQAGGEDVRSPKPTVTLPARFSTLEKLLIAGTLALAALALVALAIRAIRRRRARPKPTGPPRPIEERAREALEQIARGGLLERGLIQDYFDQVSDVIRLYLGRRYGFRGIATTTSELIEALREPLASDGRLQRVEEFSNEADLAKFARWRPDRAVCAHFLQTAYRVIDETTPHAPAPEGADMREAPEPIAPTVRR